MLASMASARKCLTRRSHRRLGLAVRLCRGVVVAALARWSAGVMSNTFLPASAGRAQPGNGAREQSTALGVALPPMQTAAAVAGLALTAGGGTAEASMLTSAAAEGAIDPINAIVQAFSLTFVSEIGDKTFFIAAILAAGGADGVAKDQSQKVLTFIGAIAALAVMTFLAVALGQIFHSVPDLAGGLPLDDYASVAAFSYFGVKLLLDASTMPDDGSVAAEEREEAAEAVREASLPSWLTNSPVPPLVFEAFVLVFAAEIGDRSFISATALSAQGGAESGAAVFLGSISAHGIATLIAVLLGELISKYISEKTITYIGGVLFLIFAASSAASLAGLV